MLLVSIAASLMFSVSYGILRSASFFGLDWRIIVCDWLQPAARLALILVPITAVTGWLTRDLGPGVRLAVGAVIPGMLGAVVLVRWGLEAPVKQQLRDALPARFRRWLI